jgi:type II secretory pathway pseudopilin PulG
MIELIFVIVIIGILAAVAIPKLAGTAQEAKKSNYISFMGTLNRSIGPAMWAANVGTNNGEINATTDTDFKANYSDVPAGITFAFRNCTGPGEAPGVVATISAADSGLPKEMKIYCKNGTPTESPTFGFAADGNKTDPTFAYSN